MNKKYLFIHVRLLLSAQILRCDKSSLQHGQLLHNSISQSVNLKHQQHQQQLVRNDKPTLQLTAHFPRHPDNADVTATAAERQYFVLDPEQQ